MTSDNHPFKNKTELNAFLRVHDTIKTRMSATVWLFESGDFYVLCDTDMAFSDESVPAANVVKYSYARNENVHVKLVRVHTKNLRQLLRHILLVRHFRLEMFGSGSTNLSYEKVATASPCDLGEVKDLLFSEEDAEYNEALRMGPICAIVLEGGKDAKIGMAFYHDATKSVRLAEFFDNSAMDLLESMVIQYSPVECLVSGQLKYRTVRSVLSRNKILVSNDLPNNSEIEKAMGEISRLVDLDVNKSPDATVASKRALAILNLHVKLSAEKMCENGAKFVDTQEFVRFNAQADEGLNIFDGAQHGFSLFKVLNKTRTAGGERLLKVWLKQPLTDTQKIMERLDMVEQLVLDTSARKTIHESHLRKIPDLESLSIKLTDKRANLSDLYKIYMAIKEVEQIAEIFRQMKTDNPILNEHFGVPFVKKLTKMEKFQDLVKTTLDFDALSSVDNVFRVKAAFDDTLLQIRSEMDKLKKAIESSASSMASTLNMDQKNLKLDWSNQHGYCFRVTLKDETNLRSKKGILVVDSSKSGVRFRNRDLEAMNKEYRSLNEDYEKQQTFVVTEIIQIAHGYVPYIAELGHLCSKLDCLVSFSVASVSAPIPYIKPQILMRDEGILRLEEARHPCLELMDGINFIPNGVDFKSEDRTFCIITGPNLGGKSTYLRSIALNVLMAQVGCFVAASEAALFPVDRILVRIGAGDSQLTGISTFMAEMLEASTIVRSATKHSLILIDELGRGTSTYDGLGLAWSISHFISSEIKAFSLFATHFHEITRLCQEVPNVFNCHVDAVTDEYEFTLLYNVRPGSSSKSFGLEVARLAGFPSEVLSDAKEYLSQAEMPLLRGNRQSGGLDPAEVKKFLSEWKDDGTGEKRKSEMLADLKIKVAKICSSN